MGGRTDDGDRDLRLGVAAAVADGVVVPGDVTVRAGRITAIGCSAPGRGLAIPGLVDLQVNGVADVDLRTADPDAVARMATALAGQGCTAFRPTLHSTDVDGYVAALGRLDHAREAARAAATPTGARVLGAHLEGPFLSGRWAGAHDPSTLLPVDRDVLVRLLGAGSVGMVTLAPELPGAAGVVRSLVDAGVVVSIGHSDATADTVRAAVDLGVTHVTHCWNAHRRFAPRDPGPAGVALVDDRLTIGLIGDLVHVDADVVCATLAAAPGRVAVTTDSIAVSGAGAGPARLRGGLLGPLEVLRGLRALGMDWPALVDACSGAAERTAGGPGRGLVPGAVADVVVVDDRTELVRTLVDGVEVARS